MNENNNTIREILKKAEGKIFIWGGGNSGIFMECFLKEGGVTVTAFIDKRENYHGKVLVDNVVCQLPKQMTEKDACVITVSPKSVNEVYKKCMELNFGRIFICDTEDLNKYRESIDDETYLQYMWQWIMKTELQLKNPITFNEKLQWLKLYDRKSYYSSLVDKLAVRNYVEDTIGSRYLVPLIGVFYNFNEINFRKLPSKFILKCTHDSGSYVICKDKNEFDYFGVMKELSLALEKNYYNYSREWPYKNIKPRIICEELLLMEDGKLPYDYKVHCFYGKPDFFSIAIDRETDLSFNYYDSTYQLINDTVLKEKGTGKDIILPPKEKLDELFLLSEKLSQGLPYCRVDFLYQKEFFFSEITFFPDAGMNPDWSNEQQLYVGLMLDLSVIEGGKKL